MVTAWERVHVFISSTFSDMHAERDYLVKQVFPQLQEWCERRKLRLVDIDLRWGVTEQDATHNRNAVKVCLSRIDDCRPFFLCFLGQRRGWVPGADEISEDTFELFPDLKNHAGKASVTEMEVLHALITPFHGNKPRDPDKHPDYYDRAKHAFFYSRAPSYLVELPLDPPQLRHIYTNEGIDDSEERKIHDRELERWREQQIPHSGRPVHSYRADWNPNGSTPEIAIPLQCPSTDSESAARWRYQWAKAGVSVTGLDVTEDPEQADIARDFNARLSTGRLTGFRCNDTPLSEIILNDLKQAIRERYPHHLEVTDETELQKELDQQEQFLFANSEGFIEREGDFSRLDAYADGDSDKLFVLAAPGGMGKSTLLANWIDRYWVRTQGLPGHSVHFRFIGASDLSTTVGSLLRYLMLELQQIAGKIPAATTETIEAPSGNEITREVSFEIPQDPIKVENLWNEQLPAIGKNGKTVIVIDALNQLESGLSDLTWLSWKLPPNIKLIVSFRRGEEGAERFLRHLDESGEVILSEVPPFASLLDRRRLVRAYLSQYLKDLDEDLQESLIESEGAGNPLFLKVVLSELRVFGAYGGLSEKIGRDFGDTPVSAFEGVLSRLETDPAYSPIMSKDAVPLLFGLLAHARYGLSTEELTAIFIQALEKADTDQERKTAADAVHLILRQVRPFLARRDGRYDFFFESFKFAALDRYLAMVPGESLPKRKALGWHGLLAQYFRGLRTWIESAPLSEDPLSPRKKPTFRKVAELPYHETHGELWPELEETLTDLFFIEAKCAAGMTYDLVADYNRALDALPEGQEKKKKAREREERIARYTREIIAYARAWNEARDQHAANPENNPLPKPEDIPLPEIIPSVYPWTDEEIDADIRRTIENPSRLDRVSAFTQFVSSEMHNLIRFRSQPRFCIQQAYNSAGSGPVHLEAQTILALPTLEPMLLTSKESLPKFNTHPTCIQTMRGHSHWAVSVSLTPDGRRAVSASSDYTLRLWDLESGRCMQILEGHSCQVRTVSVTCELIDLG